MDTHRFILKQLKDHTGPLDAEAVHARIIHMLNTPFFQSGGSIDDVQVVQRCFDEFQGLVSHGPAPKQYMSQVLRLGERWYRLGNSDAGTPSQRALLRYNSALLHSVVIEAINATEQEQDREG